MTITLDPGHGQFKNPGVLAGYYEGTRVFMLAYELKKELEKYEDVTVRVTREKLEDDPSLTTRGKSAGKNGSTLFISLHTNAASNPTAHGVSVFRSVKRPGSEELGCLLGKAVVKTMKKHTDITYLRGVMTRTQSGDGGVIEDYYGVIRNSVKYDCVKYSYIIEHGFHTNETECAYMYGDGSLSEIARAEADVIGGYFGLKKKKDPDPGYVEYTVKPGDTLIGIARKYGTTYKILAEYNGIKDPDLIHTGQIIKIPCPAEINVGDVVRLREGVYTYFPGGKKFSSWVKDYDYVVSKTADNSGGPVYRGGARCVLLGAKVDRKSGEHGSPINSWASLEYIEKVYYENKQER